MNYNELTRRHFETALHAGELSGAGTRRGTAGDRVSGTWVQFDVQWAEAAANGTIRVRAAKFRAFGCPHVIAVADWLAAQAVGREARAGLPIRIAALQQRFDVPTPKLGRLLIIEDAWTAAFAPPDRGSAA